MDLPPEHAELFHHSRAGRRDVKTKVANEKLHIRDAFQMHGHPSRWIRKPRQRNYTERSESADGSRCLTGSRTTTTRVLSNPILYSNCSVRYVRRNGTEVGKFDEEGLCGNCRYDSHDRHDRIRRRFTLSDKLVSIVFVQEDVPDRGAKTDHDPVRDRSTG